MIRPSAHVIDTLRRESPGALTLRALSQRLSDRGLRTLGSPGRLRAQLRDSGTPLRTLEFPGSRGENGHGEPLDTWVLLDSDEAAPDAEPLVLALWGTLRLLAGEVDPESRVSLSRWMLKAAETVDLFRLLRERGPPPTILLRSLPRPGSNQVLSGEPPRRLAAR